MEELDCLFDDRRTQLRLVLMGRPDALDLVARYQWIDGHLERAVLVEGLSDTDAVRWLPQSHPFYKDVPAEVISYVNQNFAHGSFKAWQRFTRDAMYECAQRDARLNEHIAYVVFVRQRGAQLLQPREAD